MSTLQSGSRARHGGALDGARPVRSVTVSTNGDCPRPDLPRTGAGAVVSSGSTGADLYDWIALRRVNDGGIARMGDRWLDKGLRVPCYVTDALTALCDNGLVRLAELDECGMQRAALTDAGTVRYQQLCEQRATIRPLRGAARSAPAGTWLADHPQAHNVVQSVWDTLAELEQAGHHPGAIAALRRVLTSHQPTPAGRCRACRRHRWRRRRFPCIVWHQIHSALR